MKIICVQSELDDSKTMCGKIYSSSSVFDDYWCAGKAFYDLNEYTIKELTDLHKTYGVCPACENSEEAAMITLAFQIKME